MMTQHFRYADHAIIYYQKFYSQQFYQNEKITFQGTIKCLEDKVPLGICISIMLTIQFMSLKTVCQNTTNTCSTLDNIPVEFKYYFQWHVKHNNTVCVISLTQSQLLYFTLI